MSDSSKSTVQGALNAYTGGRWKIKDPWTRQCAMVAVGFRSWEFRVAAAILEELRRDLHRQQFLTRRQARVLTKGDVRKFNNQRGEGQLFKARLCYCNVYQAALGDAHGWVDRLACPALLPRDRMGSANGRQVTPAAPGLSCHRVQQQCYIGAS